MTSSSFSENKKYLHNTGWVVAEKLLRLIAAVFVGAYVARYLGPSEYGELNYAISLISLFTVFTTLGLDTILVRELVHHDGLQDKLLGTSFILRLSSSFLLTVALYVVPLFIPTQPVTAALLFIIAIGMIFQAFSVIDYFFQAKVMSRYAMLTQMAALVIVSILRVVLVLKQAPLIWFAIAQTADFVIVAIGLVYCYFRSGYHLARWQFRLSVARDLMRDAWPMILASLSVTVYLRIDQVMIKWMMGDVATGYYSVAVRLSEVWNFIPVAICGSVFPAIVLAKRDNAEAYGNLMRGLYALMVALSVFVAIPVMVFSRFIVSLLFGDAFIEASSILTLYVWSGVFVFLGVASGKWVISENLQVFRMKSMVTAALLNIVLNYLLIKWIGLTGSAIATLVAYAYASYFSFLTTAKTRPVFMEMTRSFNFFKLKENLELLQLFRRDKKES